MPTRHATFYSRRKPLRPFDEVWVDLKRLARVLARRCALRAAENGVQARQLNGRFTKRKSPGDEPGDSIGK